MLETKIMLVLTVLLGDQEVLLTVVEKMHSVNSWIWFSSFSQGTVNFSPFLIMEEYHFLQAPLEQPLQVQFVVSHEHIISSNLLQEELILSYKLSIGITISSRHFKSDV